MGAVWERLQTCLSVQGLEKVSLLTFLVSSTSKSQLSNKLIL